MNDRLDVLKTYKLYIDGKFPRTESGRTLIVVDSRGAVAGHICRASRKDLREAVEAARRAQAGWGAATPYLRGQILYRMAEMLEGKRREFADLLDARQVGETVPVRGVGKSASRARTAAQREAEVAAAIDRLVNYAGWADKYAQVLGCNNPVAGPYYNFTVPEPTGVVGVVAPDEFPLLALVSLIAPVLCAGSTVVALASEASPLAGAVLGEVCATGDVPGGVVNILTGLRPELLPFFSSHREIDAVHAGGLSGAETTVLREGTAENVKRVVVRGVGVSMPVKAGTTLAKRHSRGTGIDWLDAEACQDPWWIEPFVEMKTIWHPASS